MKFISQCDQTTAQTILRDVWVTGNACLSILDRAFLDLLAEPGERPLATCLRVAGVSEADRAKLAGKSFETWQATFRSLNFALPPQTTVKTKLKRTPAERLESIRDLAGEIHAGGCIDWRCAQILIDAAALLPAVKHLGPDGVPSRPRAGFDWCDDHFNTRSQVEQAIASALAEYLGQADAGAVESGDTAYCLQVSVKILAD